MDIENARWSSSNCIKIICSINTKCNSYGSFLLVKIAFEATPYGSIHEFIFKFLQMPLLKLGNSLGAMAIAYIFLHLFWFFGINGSSVVGAVYNPILKILSAENLAFQAGSKYQT